MKWVKLQLQEWAAEDLISDYQRHSLEAHLNTQHQYRVKRYMKWMSAILGSILVMSIIIVLMILARVSALSTAS